MRSSTRERIKRINNDPNLTRLQKTREIQNILSGHIKFQDTKPTQRAKSPSLPPINVNNSKQSIFDSVKGIVYADRSKNSEYVAAGVKTVNLPANRPADEFCIFSQERLTDCTVGAIVVSSTRHGQLEWCYLCNPTIPLDDRELSGVHLFDVDYLTQWVKREGAEYIKCPLCRTGSKLKKNVEEHEIETMQALQERRTAAQREGDQQMLFFVEGLMLTKALSEKWDPVEHSDSFKVNSDVLQLVCGHWMKRWSPNEFGQTVKMAVTKGLQVDNVQMLQILFSDMFKPQQTWATEMCSEFLAIAAKYGAVDSVNLLLSFGARQGIEAPALTEAIKTRNQPLVDVIIQSMIKQQSENESRSFVCGTLFPDVIKYNMVEAAQAIIENRWHKPTNRDLDLAKSVDNDVYRYLNDRQCAALSLHDDDGDLDLDDWADADMDDDDDW